MAYKYKDDYNKWKRANYRANQEKELARKKKYHLTRKGRANLYAGIAKYRLRYPEKVRARQILQYHLKKGFIKKEKCKCGKRITHAHHSDYTKPLAVIWLCTKCHGLEHRKFK